jgi:hypothetical protein
MSAKSGWYPDPDGKGGQRYFDGARWTEARIAGKKPAPWASLPIAGRIVLAVLGAVVVVVIAVVASTVGAGDKNSHAAGVEDGRIEGQTLLGLGGRSVPDAQIETACDRRTSVAAYQGVYWSQGRIERGDLDKDAYRDGCMEGARAVFGR